MKIIIPLGEDAGLNSAVHDHFGSCPFYALVNTQDGSLAILPNAAMHHDHGQCTPADLFAANGIDAVLCKGIGAGAISRLQALGITVYTMPTARTADEAIEAFNQGTLEKVNAHHTCQGHNCH